MALSDLGLDLRRLPAPLPIWHAPVDREAWSAAARGVAEQGGRLVSLWGIDRDTGAGGAAVCAAYAVLDGLAWLELPVHPTRSFPDLAPIFPSANRMQRAITDLSGLAAEGAGDSRPWLDHGVWALPVAPLSYGNSSRLAGSAVLPTDYPFVRVEGDGVHEIAVGPVHAGIIEPGHFRFQCHGEEILHLEVVLGYQHRGV